MINLIFINGDNAFSPAEVSTVLDHVLSRASLLTAAALRLCGHSATAAACASFAGMEGAPEALGAALAFYEKDQADAWASLLDEARENLGDKFIRGEWKRLRAVASIAAKDSAMSFRVSDFKARPVSEFKKEKAAKRFAALVESKRPKGNAPTGLGGTYAVTSH